MRKREDMDKQIIPVGAAVIVSPDAPRHVLMKYRAEDESRDAEQNWEFPGGVMKYGETPEQTVEREIREELHLIIQVNRLLHAQSNVYMSRKHFLVLYYECQTNYQAAPDGCRWVRLHDEIFELPVLPGTREVARLLL